MPVGLDVGAEVAAILATALLIEADERVGCVHDACVAYLVDHDAPQSRLAIGFTAFHEFLYGTLIL
jgi:hypothetical protein